MLTLLYDQLKNVKPGQPQAPSSSSGSFDDVAGQAPSKGGLMDTLKDTKSQNNIFKIIRKNSGPFVDTLKDVAPFAGSALMQSDVSPGASFVGGALSGIGGGIPGMAIGGVSGLANFYQKKQTMEEQLAEYMKNRMSSKTTEPFAGYYGKGGKIKLKKKHKSAFSEYAKSRGMTMQQAVADIMQGGGSIEGGDPADVTELLSIQAEVGEWMVTPSGELVPVMAKKKHSEMEPGEVTDKVGSGSYVFSDQTEIDTSNLDDEDDILFESPGYYSEKDGNIEGEKVRFTDYVGKDKATFAEKVKRLAKKIPLISEKHKDILTEMTNQRNLETRTPILLKLMAEQESSGKTSTVKNLGVQTFGKGGFVKKMARGGNPADMTKVNINGDNFWVDENGAIFTESEEGSGVLVDVGDGTQYAKNFKEAILNAAPEADKSKLMDALSKTGTVLNRVDVTDKSGKGFKPGQKTKGIDPSLLKGLRTQMRGVYDVSRAPEKERLLDVSDGGLDDIYKELGIDLDTYEQENEQNLQDQLKKGKNLVRGKNTRAGLNLAQSFLSNALQDPRVNTPLRENTFLKGKYEGTPSSVVEQQAAMLGSGQAGIARELISGGADPEDVVSMIAGMQENTVNAQSGLRSNFENQNRQQRRGYFGELNANLNANNAAIASSANAERDNLNKKINFYKNDVSQYLGNRDKIADMGYMLENSAIGEFNKNRFDLFQNRMNTNALRASNNMALMRYIQAQKDMNMAISGNPGVIPGRQNTEIAPVPVSNQGVTSLTPSIIDIGPTVNQMTGGPGASDPLTTDPYAQPNPQITFPPKTSRDLYLQYLQTRR